MIDSKGTFDSVTLGTVVDTNDPQQMGRIRVVCPAWNDSFDAPLGTIPWAVYMTPFGGMMAQGTRGPADDQTEGMTAYGMWAIPKVGAQVLVMCVDGNPGFRVWMGCVYTQHTPHTMPHGRFSNQDDSNLEATGKPEGPFSSYEKFIEPLHQNYQEAFGTDRQDNYEWKTRGADRTVSAVDIEAIPDTLSLVADDKDVEGLRQGYDLSRIHPDKQYTSTGSNYDSLVYAWVSPGFHAFSMDDREDNCRMRMRTTSGHQIILDDTNERIYIATAEGKNWIEMDQSGNIDIYSDRRISVHSASDINLTSDKSIRMFAKENIHMVAETGDVRVHAKNNVLAYGENELRLQSNNVSIKADSNIFSEAAANVNQKAGGALNLQSGGSSNINAGGNVLVTGSAIHWNGPPASTADSASSANANGELAFWTNRVPQHEPWARSMTADDYSHGSELSYDDPNVGRVELGETIDRGPNWQR